MRIATLRSMIPWKNKGCSCVPWRLNHRYCGRNSIPRLPRPFPGTASRGVGRCQEGETDHRSRRPRYGKSSLAAEFLQKWATLRLVSSRGDRFGPLEFPLLPSGGLGGIHGVSAIRRETHGRCDQRERAEQGRPVHLHHELDELIAEELFIVLDDFNSVNDSPTSRKRSISSWAHAPNLHFIILSRSRLNLQLSRLRAGRNCWSCGSPTSVLPLRRRPGCSPTSSR